MEPAVQREVVKNRIESTELWADTDRDIAIANIVSEAERVQTSRRQVLIGLLLFIIVLAAGLIYARQTEAHDRLLAQESRAAAEKPYVPLTVPPNP